MDLTFAYPAKGTASRYVSALPDEFLRYELESQGVRVDQNYFRRKKQLADLLENREYRAGKYFVSMRYQEDIDTCAAHLNNWKGEYDASANKKNLMGMYVIRLRHLQARISRIAVPDSDEGCKLKLSTMKAKIIQFKNALCPEQRSVSFTPSVRTASPGHDPSMSRRSRNTTVDIKYRGVDNAQRFQD